MDASNPFAQLLADVGRSAKPRTDGLTIVIDTGLGPHRVDDLASLVGAHVDQAKIAWASSTVSGGLLAKLEQYRRHDIQPLLGGSLFEYAYIWGKLDLLEALVREHRCSIEISDGVATVPRRDKLRWIETFAKYVPVLSEVGGKLAPHDLDWPAAIREELAAGARHVVVEGREIGPTGKDIQVEFVDRIVNAVEPRLLVFEALERYQQTWLVRHLGPNVNLGNIRGDDVLMLECIRRGLKEQTMLETHARARAGS